MVLDKATSSETLGDNLNVDGEQVAEVDRIQFPIDEGGEQNSGGGRGTWKHAAFHVATTIATPAAYAPLPFALASLGWPFGMY